MLYQGSVSDYSIQIMPSNWTGPFGYTRLVVLYVALSGGGNGIAELCFVPAGRPVPDGSVKTTFQPLTAEPVSLVTV